MSRRYSYEDFRNLESDLNIDHDNLNNEKFRIPLCPKIVVSIFSVPFPVLVDTGSQVTAISEECYKYLLMHATCVELPISSLSLFTAIGKKSTSIKKQVMIDLFLGENIYPSCFLVVPGLSNSLILGNDWFLKYRVIIDYQSCSFVVDGISVPESLVKFDGEPSKGLLLKEAQDDVQYIQSMSQSDSDIDFCNVIASQNIQRNIIGDLETVNIKKDYHFDDKNLICVDNIFDELFFEDNNSEGRHVKNLESNQIQIKNLNNVKENSNISFVRDDLFFKDNYDNRSNCDNYGKIDSMEEKVIDSIQFDETLWSIILAIPNLTDNERKSFVERMLKFERLFTPKRESANVPPYRLRIKEHKHYIRKHYPVPLVHRGKVDLKIDSMEDDGIRERCDGCYCNPLRIVIKNDGSVRVCLDARFINSIIEDDHESPPLVSELLQKFFGTTFMSTTDLDTGYWQIPLH